MNPIFYGVIRLLKFINSAANVCSTRSCAISHRPYCYLSESHQRIFLFFWFFKHEQKALQSSPCELLFIRIQLLAVFS